MTAITVYATQNKKLIINFADMTISYPYVRTQSNACSRVEDCIGSGEIENRNPEYWGSSCCGHALKPSRLNTRR